MNYYARNDRGWDVEYTFKMTQAGPKLLTTGQHDKWTTTMKGKVLFTEEDSRSTATITMF
ncbi:hypothetical protein ACFSC4_27160 [Deinococcus malanensis]|uniref:hypothetical protein n=1 Tax=Deinococcus malanensis TaxID=1706855 RepID=UPI0036330D77